jgi:ribose transport system permease protein
MTSGITEPTVDATRSTDSRSAPAGSRRDWLRNQALIVWVLLLLCFPLSRFASESFPSVSLVVNVLILGLFLAVIAFGQGLVVLTGGIDLSVASSVALGAYLTGSLWAAGIPAVVAVILAVVACTAVGAINGLVISRFGFPAFIVTLAVGTILASVLLGVSRGAPAQRSPEGLAALFRQETTLIGVPVAMWLFLVMAGLGLFVQHKTTLGLHAYAIGNSVAAARNARVDVARATVTVYGVAGAAYGLAGVMLLGYSSGADLNVGEPWLLPSIAAVVVGGAAIRGGSGTYSGTLAGALLLTLLGIDISATNLAEGYKQIVYGAVILIALLGSRLAGRRN